MACMSRTLSADGRRSLDSIAFTRSAPTPPLPQPYWRSPASHDVQQQQQQAASQRQNGSQQPVKNLLPPSLPSLQEQDSPERPLQSANSSREEDTEQKEEGTPAQHGSVALSSLPIVLSRQNSTSSEGDEDDAASEPEAAGELSTTSEDAASAEGSAQTTVEIPEAAQHASGMLLHVHAFRFLSLFM